MSGSVSGKRLRVLSVVVGGVVLVGTVLYKLSSAHPHDAKTAKPEVRVERMDGEDRAFLSAVLVRALKQVASSPVVEVAPDGVPIMAAVGDSTADDPRHPHPITAEHERIFRENALVGSLGGAMDVGDFEGIRRLNDEYKKAHPERVTLQAGYDIIADCLENKTPDARARAQKYCDNERASTVRRFVRRHCLE